MSQRDLVAELRAVHLTAPPEVRERVRLIAANAATAPPRRFLRRRSLVLLVPVAAALAAAVVLARPHSGAQTRQGLALQPETAVHGGATTPGAGAPNAATGSKAAAPKSFAPAPSPTRAQRYGATIGLRVASARAVSTAVKAALRITSTLGGHPTSVHASASGKAGTADLVLRIPRRHVQEAVTRLSQLGTITSEQVDIQDLQAGIDSTNRTIARLQKQLATLRAQPETPQRDRAIASLTARIQRLQRAEAATLRAAQFATVRVHVSTPPSPVPAHHGHSPLHGIGVGAYWTGIGALYALAFGVPLLLLGGLVYLVARSVRRRRVDALLSRP
jgi:Domain of unknown function (DUF4349)